MYNPSYQPSFGQQSFGQQQGFGQQQSFNPQQSFGQQVQSQYRGLQKKFQPSGTVQSFYQPQQASWTATKTFQASGFAGNQANQNTPVQNYHTASYDGNQPNHDASLRADSTRPSFAASNQGQSFGSATSAQGSFQQPSVQSAGFQGAAGFTASRTQSAGAMSGLQGMNANVTASANPFSQVPSSFSPYRNF